VGNKIADQYLLSTGYCGIKPKGVSSSFLKQIFLSDKFNSVKDTLSTGSTQQGIGNEDLNQITVVIPPLPEQDKISEILTTVDENIEETDKIIADCERIKKGMMQTLLTKGIPGKHKKFKQTEIGEIPEEWEVKKLGDLIEKLEAGVSVNSEDRHTRTGEKGILKTGAVQNGKFVLSEHKTILPSEISRATIHPRKDSIVISRMNTPELVGELGYVDKDYNDFFLPDRLWQTVFRKNVSVCVRWLTYLLISPKVKPQIKGAATGTSNSMKNISKETLLNLRIPYPPTWEQEEISEHLNSVDEKIQIETMKKQSSLRMKRALMQKLLSGEIRVKV
jgi:type I restriction enzyme S subunit